MGGMEGPRRLCSGAGRVGSSVGSVGDALLLWSGPHRRAAEVALLAPLGGARRSREWSAWATTGAAVWGQATLPPPSEIWRGWTPQCIHAWTPILAAAIISRDLRVAQGGTPPAYCTSLSDAITPRLASDRLAERRRGRKRAPLYQA